MMVGVEQEKNVDESKNQQSCPDRHPCFCRLQFRASFDVALIIQPAFAASPSTRKTE
jgi:hypothetical protein